MYSPISFIPMNEYAIFIRINVDDNNFGGITFKQFCVILIHVQNF